MTPPCWEKFHAAIDVVGGMSASEIGYSSAIEELEKLSTILARQADIVVQLYEADSTAKLNILRNIQFGFLFYCGEWGFDEVAGSSYVVAVGEKGGKMGIRLNLGRAFTVIIDC